MVVFRTFNDIVISFIEFLRLVQPDLDTKPGTVARDLFVDAPSEQLAALYDGLQKISSLQSFFSANGDDLSKLGSNFGVSKSQGSTATGVAVFTTSNLDSDILVSENTIITAKNGITFKTTASFILRASSANVYKSTGVRLRNELELASITDDFAVEIPVEALITGTSGNIGAYQLVSQNIAGISNITNLETFSGGTNSESDADFRNRILSVFAGSNTGTALGYETAVSTVNGVQDVISVVPGDPLLTRDGTQVATDSNGNLIVSDPGSGGKVDLYVLGEQLASSIDSFIYNDQSGLGETTSSENDVILGQRGQDTALNSSQRRVELIAANTLPFQPADSIISVVGSSSGSNFVEKFTDTDGTIKGNYELIKDTGDLGGSAFGFDKLRWISSEIELVDEEVTKGIFNGSDPLLFSDVIDIKEITQDIFVTNENSITSTTNRSSVQLKHTPSRTVSRIINLTTGERYVVSDQNPNGADGKINVSGIITISGNTLPVATDVLQVDYIWIKPYDRIFDFDSLLNRNNFRTAQDSVDWSFGNLVRYEPNTVADDGYGVLTVDLLHDISRVISVDTLLTETVTVSNGVVVLSVIALNIIDMKRVSDDAEIFNTDLFDGALSGTSSVSLPTDTLATDGDSVIVRFNASDIFSPDGYTPGSFSSDIVTLPDAVTVNGTSVLVSYIANIKTLLPTTEISNLPALKSNNKFDIDGVLLGDQPISNLLDSNDDEIQNIRRAASVIRLTAAAIGSVGTVNINGTTIHKVEDVLLTITSGNGYDIPLISAIKSDLGVVTLPSTVKVVMLKKVERVDVNNLGLITAIDNTYDILNYTILDNSFDLDVSLVDLSLNSSTVSLSRTSGNTTAILSTADVVRVTFYYIVENDLESVFFSRNGSLITDKVFHTIDRVSLSSGFLNPAGNVAGEITVTNLNQPLDNTTYNVDYNYTSPKENERITITFNTNTVPADATLVVEKVRSITADVLIKEAVAKDIDVTIKVIILPSFVESESTVLQDATDATTEFLNANSLGTTVDASDLSNHLYTVSGIDRVTIFNFSAGEGGNVLSISANKNQFLLAGDISITSEER